MAANGRSRARGAADWVEQLRESLGDQAPLAEEAVFEAAYEAGEVDAPMMFDYFEGRLSEEDRHFVETEVAASPHALRKLARIGAIVAQRCGGPLPPTNVVLPSNPPAIVEAQAPKLAKRHRVWLGAPRTRTPGHLGARTFPGPNDSVRLPSDAQYELERTLEADVDWLRITHQSYPVGTLLGVRLTEASAESLNNPANVEPTSPTQFVVLRRASGSTTTATCTVPASLNRGPVWLELSEIPLEQLSIEQAACILNSFEKAREEDPISVTPLHEPRSAWQTWADQTLQRAEDQIHPALWEVAELIAMS